MIIFACQPSRAQQSEKYESNKKCDCAYNIIFPSKSQWNIIGPHSSHEIMTESMTNRIQKLAAIVAVCGCFVQIIFQFCLSIGAPWGTAAWGGQQAMADGSLPTNLRMASGAGVALWTFISSVVVQRISRKLDGSVMEQQSDGGGGTLRIRWCQCYPPKFVSCTMWVLTVLMFLTTVENFMSRSPVERWTWGPFCTVVFLSFLILARSEDRSVSSEGTHLLPSETAPAATTAAMEEYV